jgi:hypothetical protein
VSSIGWTNPDLNGVTQRRDLIFVTSRLPENGSCSGHGWPSSSCIRCLFNKRICAGTAIQERKNPVPAVVLQLVRATSPRACDGFVRHVRVRYGKREMIKIEFSRRGGHHYSPTRAYHFYLGFQQEGDRYIPEAPAVTKLLSTDLMEDHPHYSRAGLQLADATASAFIRLSTVRDQGAGTRHRQGAADIWLARRRTGQGFWRRTVSNPASRQS